MEILDWETFFDNFFAEYNMIVKKNFDKKGILKMSYIKHAIWIECLLDVENNTVLNLLFGTLLNSELNSPALYNDIVGNFIAGSSPNVNFLQNLVFSFYDNECNIHFNQHNRKAVNDFLQIPCKLGWVETEYMIGDKEPYKIAVELLYNNTNLIWNIFLEEGDGMDSGGDFFPKLRARFNDSFLMNFSRKIKRKTIHPVNKN